MFRKYTFMIIIILLLFTSCSGKKTGQDQSVSPARGKYKVLHVMSYHSPWKWTDDQFNGFKESFTDQDVEYKMIQCDQKNTSESKLKNVLVEIKDTISSWKPDLVYTTDDWIQENLVMTDYLNTDLNFVFSGVNSSPETYNYVGSKNVAGVLEYELFIPLVNMLKKIIPDLKKMAFITDTDEFWVSIIQRMNEKTRNNFPEIEIVGSHTIKTYKEYQEIMLNYQGKVDAIGLMGIFLFQDENGNNVSFEEVMKWTVENSKVPDFSYWEDRVDKGTLCALTASGYEQGLAAGKIARGILVDKKSPSSFEFKPTIKGEPIISLARAKKIGLNIDSNFLLTVNVKDKILD